MTQYWNNTTAALQPTCRGRRRGGPSGASRGPCLPTSLSGVTNRTAVQPTYSLTYFCIIPLEIYSVVFPLSLILHHLMLWNKLAILIIHPSIYHLFIFLSIYLSTHLPIQPSTYPPIYSSIYLPIHQPDIHCQLTHLSIYHPCIQPLTIYLHPSSSIYQSIHRLTCLSLRSSTIHILDIHYQPTHLDIYPSIHLSTCPSICSSIQPPIYPHP